MMLNACLRVQKRGDCDGFPSLLYLKSPNLSLKLVLCVLILLGWALWRRGIYKAAWRLCSLYSGATGECSEDGSLWGQTR